MEILNSWKEIANYLGRGVRTVQRWERDLGLPVHRPKGKDRSAVMAFPRELEAWLHDTPVRSQEWAVQNSGNGKSLNGTGYVAVALSETGEPQRLPAGRVRVVVTLRDVHQSCARSRQLGAKLVEATRRQQALAAMIQESLAKIARGARSRTTIDQRSV